MSPIRYLKPRAARSCSDKKHPLSPGPSGRPRCRHSSRWLCVCPQPDGGQRGPATGHCRARRRRRRGVERLVKAPALAVRLLERLQRAGELPLVQALVHLVVEAAQPAQGSVRGASSARRGARQRRAAGAPLAQGLVVGRVRLDRVLSEHLAEVAGTLQGRGAIAALPMQPAPATTAPLRRGSARKRAERTRARLASAAAWVASDISLHHAQRRGSGVDAHARRTTEWGEGARPTRQTMQHVPGSGSQRSTYCGLLSRRIWCHPRRDSPCKHGQE